MVSVPSRRPSTTYMVPESNRASKDSLPVRGISSSQHLSPFYTHAHHRNSSVVTIDLRLPETVNHSIYQRHSLAPLRKHSRDVVNHSAATSAASLPNFLFQSPDQSNEHIKESNEFVNKNRRDINYSASNYAASDDSAKAYFERKKPTVTPATPRGGNEGL
jgi:hypothetical protein